MSHHNSASRSFLEGRHRPSAQSFPEDAGPYGSGIAGTSAGSASYATHPVLVETVCSSSGLVSWTPPRNGDSGLCIGPDPLEEPPLAKARHDSRHGAQNGRLSRQTLPTMVGERCVRANRPSVYGPWRNRPCTSTA